MNRKPNSCRYWIKQFQEDFYQRGRSHGTWETDYWKILKQLPPEQPLTAARLHQLVTSTQPNTKTRRRACIVAQQMARFAKLETMTPSPTKASTRPESLSPETSPLTS